MINPNIKFTLNNFEYFLLNIKSNVTITKIMAKLESFVQLDQEYKNLVIELEDNVADDSLLSIIDTVKSFCTKNKINFYAIKHNEYTNFTQISDINVIKFPISNTIIEQVYAKSLLINEPVRGGMKFENSGDVISTDFIADGAEIIAGGSIHIYNEARGRLIAGSNGDKSARIFVLKFNPSLVAIAGIYRALDGDLPKNILNKAVQVFLDDKERINIISLS